MRYLSIFLALLLLVGMSQAAWYPRSENYTTTGWVVATAGADITGPIYQGGAVVANASDLEANQTRIVALEGNDTVHDADIAANATKADNALAWLALNETAIGIVETDLGANETRIIALEGNDTVHDADISANATKADNALAWLALNETNIAANATKVDNALAWLALNETAIGEVATDLGNNETRIAALESNDSMIGAIASGSIQFGAAADCTSVTIGGIEYTYSATPTATLGEWGPYGASGSDTAAALVAGIVGDERNGGGAYFAATANTDTVTVYQLAVGVPATPEITKTGGTDTVTIENFAGGVDPAYTDFVMFEHVVTALDVADGVLVNIPLPFAPSFYQAFITDSSGVSRPTVTDTFSIGTTPNRIILTAGGATHVVATDKIIIYAYE